MLAIGDASAKAEDKIRLGLFTATPVTWNLDANWRAFEQTVERYAVEHPDIVVTPESWLDGYAAGEADEAKLFDPEQSKRLQSIAQDEETSPYVAKVRALALKHHFSVLFGLTEKRDGHYYNTALLIGKDGRIVGRYDKTHLQGHDHVFAPGMSLPVFDTTWGKTGVLICADRRWPETARVLRLKGSRLTLIPSDGMWSLDNEWWMRTRSYENENFIAFVHPNVAFVTNPKGEVIAKLQTNRPSLLVVDVDLTEVTEDTHLKDRRPDLYEEITHPQK